MTCILNMKNFCLNVYAHVYIYPWEVVMKTNKGTQERCKIRRYQGSGKEECLSTQDIKQKEFSVKGGREARETTSEDKFTIMLIPLNSNARN